MQPAVQQPQQQPQKQPQTRLQTQPQRQPQKQSQQQLRKQPQQQSQQQPDQQQLLLQVLQKVEELGHQVKQLQERVDARPATPRGPAPPRGRGTSAGLASASQWKDEDRCDHDNILGWLLRLSCGCGVLVHKNAGLNRSLGYRRACCFVSITLCAWWLLL